MTIRAQIQDGLTPVLDKVKTALPDALNRGLLEAAQHAEFHIKRELQSTHKGGVGRTGNLARSFAAAIAEYKGAPAGTAVSDLIYARIQDVGDVIEPRVASALRFRVTDNEWVTTQRVVIPARNYVAAARDNAEPGIADILDAKAQDGIDEADDG